MLMKTHINVVGAAIVKDGKLLALRRADGNEEVIHKFEFVGGKVEEGETPEQALIRECREELSLDIEVGELLNTIEYDYPNTAVCLSVYFAKPLSDYELKEHEEERWIECEKLEPDEWASADKQFLGILKKGYIKTQIAQSDEDFKLINSIAADVMHEAFDKITAEGQIDYMINLYLTPEAMKRNTSEKEYTYKLIYFNGEAAGFFAYCPAKRFQPSFEEGTFLSKLYIKKFARGKKVTSNLLASLNRPVYLTVKRDDVHSVNIFKHYGFKIAQSVTADIGGGFVMDDFLMVHGK